MIIREPIVNTGALVPVEPEVLTDDASLEQISMSHADASGVQADHLSIDEAVFDRVVLIESHLEKLRLPAYSL